MNERWQKALKAAVAAYIASLPWERGACRQAMIAHRKEKGDDANKQRSATPL